MCRVGAQYLLCVHKHKHIYAHTRTHTHTLLEWCPNCLPQRTLNGLTYCTPEQWFSKYGPYSSSMSLRWELVRNGYLSPQRNQKTCILTSPPGDSNGH